MAHAYLVMQHGASWTFDKKKGERVSVSWAGLNAVVRTKKEGEQKAKELLENKQVQYVSVQSLNLETLTLGTVKLFMQKQS